MDEVLADTLAKFLSVYNHEFDEQGDEVITRGLSPQGSAVRPAPPAALP